MIYTITYKPLTQFSVVTRAIAILNKLKNDFLYMIFEYL